jgi:hypothetical protein
MSSTIPDPARATLDIAARDRLDLLESLTVEQMATALACLACNDGSTFDAILAEANGTDESNPDAWEEAEIYCLFCGASLAIFPKYGLDWQHFVGDPSSRGPFEIYQADHSPFVGWRPCGGDPKKP